MKAVFFDIGETLGAPRLSMQLELVGLDLYPHIPRVLSDLAARSVRIGIISNTGNDTAEHLRAVLTAAGVYRFFDEQLLVYSADVQLSKDSPQIFSLAATLAGLDPGDCLFVGESAIERAHAMAAGMRVCPHPLLAASIVDGQHVRYAKISAPQNADPRGWHAALATHALVPLHIAADRAGSVYVIATDAALASLDDLGFYSDRLGPGNAPLDSDLYLLRDDRQMRSGFMHQEGSASAWFAQADSASLLLASGPEGLYVAIPWNKSVDSVHFEEAQHGHTQKLMPDPALLNEPAATAGWTGGAGVLATSPGPLDAYRPLTAGALGEILDRYTGVAAVDLDGHKLASRHIAHPDNWRATLRLAADLDAIGAGAFKVSLRRFVHEGQLLFNVEAEFGDAAHPEIVLVTAHLDSTAANSDPPYRPESDEAPGADDDGSGIAAVLAIAAVLKRAAAAQPLRRRIRFVLFNAEEFGLAGSKAYARDAAAMGESIVAVFQMDMIGYRADNDVAPRPFEVHAAYPPSPGVEALSLLLATQIAAVVPLVAPGLALPQVYHSASPDPAAGRSDHASFHERGYAACAVSEDFFAGPDAASPAAQANPHYHGAGDRVINLEYAADIARAVAAATFAIATSQPGGMT